MRTAHQGESDSCRTSTPSAEAAYTRRNKEGSFLSSVSRSGEADSKLKLDSLLGIDTRMEGMLDLPHLSDQICGIDKFGRSVPAGHYHV